MGVSRKETPKKGRDYVPQGFKIQKVMGETPTHFLYIGNSVKITSILLISIYKRRGITPQIKKGLRFKGEARGIK